MKHAFKVKERHLGRPGPTETILYDIIYVDFKNEEHIMIQSVSPAKELADNFCKTINEGLKQGWSVDSIMELMALGKEFSKIGKD